MSAADIDYKINSYRKLQEVLEYEKNFFFCVYSRKSFFFRFTCQHQYQLWRYVKLLRVSEYLLNTCNSNPIKKLLLLMIERKRNRLGNKLSIAINQNVFAKGLFIDHIGAIVVNPHARVGENCRIHGSVCIGNNGIVDSSPVIGNNVDMGWGCSVIGGITIADNVKIGANAVVNKSIDTPNSVWVGVPARQEKK